MRHLTFVLSLMALSACTLAPKYERAPLPVADTWPVEGPTSSNAQLKWRDLFLDSSLRATVDQAISNNRDLRIAASNIERAEALYGIQRAGLVPGVIANASESAGQSSANSSPTGGGYSRSYSASLAMSAYEIDLFGRVRSLNKSALESFFAARENRNAVQISLIASTGTAWLTLAADQDLLSLTRATLKLREDALTIAQGRARIGVLSDLDLSQVQVLTEQARADVLAAETRVDQDKSALTLLVGAPVPETQLPSGLKPGLVADALPVGLPSDVLLARPDVLAAEHSLKSANANIGAARAAFFPRIALTASTGQASRDLDSLFDSASHTYSFSPQISVPIFAGGANVAGLGNAKASRDIALSTYERAIQQAFSDVSSSLAVRTRIEARLSAQGAATEAAQRTLDLSQARYDTGRDSYLTLLDAQRTLYASQQSLITLNALHATNLVALYRALGNDQSLQ